MTMQKELITPAAILIGSVIIGSGLYFGLQGQGEPSPQDEDLPSSPRATSVAPVIPAPQAAPAIPAPQAPPAALAPQAAPPAGVAPPGLGLGPPPVSTDLKKRVTDGARKALEAKRADYIKTCWEPSFKKNPSPPSAKYIFNMSFDPQGREIARGVSDVRGMERPDTGQCLRMQPMGLEVPAPGAYVGVEIEVTIP